MFRFNFVRLSIKCQNIENYSHSLHNPNKMLLMYQQIPTKNLLEQLKTMILCRSVALAPLKTYLIVVVAFYAMDVYAQLEANGCKNNLFISLHSSLGIRGHFKLLVTLYYQWGKPNGNTDQ